MAGGFLRWLARFVALAMIVLASAPTNSVAVLADPIPASPPDVTLTGLTVTFRPTMAVVTWDAPVPGSAVAELSESSGFESPSRVEATGDLAVFTGLEPQTIYFTRVFPASPSGVLGDPTGTLSFITPPVQYSAAPPVVTLDSETSTSITATWDAVALAASYEVVVTDTESAEKARTVTTDKTSSTVDKLEADRRYSTRVRALNGSGEPVSDWSEPKQIETVGQLPLKAASYNIKCASCNGGESWSKRRQAVADTILGQLPDVLGLQEASQGKMKGRQTSQFMDLLNLLGDPYRVTNSSPSASGAVRVFYNSDTVELIDQGARKLPRRAGHQQRFVSWAIFKQKKTGKEFLFADTHLEPGKKFGNLRARQANTILDTLNSVNTRNLPTIIVGDLNSYRWMKDGNKPYDVFVKAGYADPLGMTFQSRGDSAPGAFVEKRINTSYSSYNDFKRKAARLSHLNGTYLDYILVNPKLRVSEWETVVKVDSKGNFIGTIPSDHNLVRATVWLP